MNIRLNEKFIKVDVADSKKLILTKLNHWRYEKEYRYYRHFDDDTIKRSIPFNNTCFKGIIFGENIDNDDKSTIVELLEGKVVKGFRYWDAITDIEKEKIILREFTPIKLVQMPSLRK